MILRIAHLLLKWGGLSLVTLLAGTAFTSGFWTFQWDNSNCTLLQLAGGDFSAGNT